MELVFTIPGLPVAQPRQRHAIKNFGGRAVAVNYTPKRDPVNAYKASAALVASQHMTGRPLIEGPVKLELCFVFPRPSRLVWKTRDMPRAWHTGRPDADNLAKAVKDALKGVCWRDDAQVCHAISWKYYGAGNEVPHTLVKIEVLE